MTRQTFRRRMIRLPSTATSRCFLLLLLSIADAREIAECVLSDGSTPCPHIPQSYHPTQCGLYMAPSTLGEDVNLGLYAGTDLPAGFTWLETAIPLQFREWGDHKDGYTDGTLWDRYIWEGDVMDIESYTDLDRDQSRAVFVPGIGCTVNSLLDLRNVQSTHGSVYDTAGLHRQTDPGVTAFTPYHAAQTVALQDIQAGTELMAQYGDFWIPDIPGVQITLETELDQAERFLRDHYLPWIQQYSGNNNNKQQGKTKQAKLSQALKDDLWELARSLPYSNYVAMSNLPRVPWSQVEAYVNDQTKIKHQKAKTNSKTTTATTDKSNDDDSIVRHFIRQSTMRSIEWLDQHGYCQDHLRVGRSTIPQAGRGAFATRPLAAGTVVAYSPLVHMGTEGQRVFWLADRQQYDLVLNYSFQHAQSTVLLTPYGGIVNYINHDSQAPNVRVRWPTRDDLVAHKPAWLQATPEFLRDTIDKIGLSFEYVALRDIAPDEEVVMDYGPAWEDAWNWYVEQYRPTNEPYVARADWTDPDGYFRTVHENEQQYYPPNLVTLCYESYTTAGPDYYEFVPVLRPLQYRVYCDILERHELDDTYEYTVRLHLQPEDHHSVVVHRFRPEGIFLYDRAYSQDWHLPGAFRHPIAIPDDVLPKSWINVVDDNLEQSDDKHDGSSQGDEL